MLGDAARWLLRHAFIRFGMVGAAGFVVDAAMLALATGQLGMDPYRSRALSIAVAMTATWLGNRYFTFAARRARGSVASLSTITCDSFCKPLEELGSMLTRKAASRSSLVMGHSTTLSKSANKSDCTTSAGRGLP